MSHSDPNFLNRWLDRNPLTRLTRARYFLTIPAFAVQSEWKGYSDIVAAYNYISPNRFVLKTIETWKPVNPDYTLCIAYANADLTVVRYRLWNAVGELFYADIPQYDGQVIKKKFRFEIWNTSTGTVTQATDVTPILTSVLQNIDYRNGQDALLTLPTAYVTDFKSEVDVDSPDMTGLMVWLDPSFGITPGAGNSVVSWADRMGNIVMQQGVAQLRPTKDVVGYVQFLVGTELDANINLNVGIGVYYVAVFSGFVGSPNNNTVYDQRGQVTSSKMSYDEAAALDVKFGVTNIATPFATGSVTIVEIDTTTGNVYVHDPSTGGSTLIGVSATTFLDTLNLKLGGGAPVGSPILDESGNPILDEHGDPLLTEQGAVVANSGFNLVELLAYSSQTPQGRANTLQYLLQGLKLPLVFPGDSILVPNQ